MPFICCRIRDLNSCHKTELSKATSGDLKGDPRKINHSVLTQTLRLGRAFTREPRKENSWKREKGVILFLVYLEKGLCAPVNDSSCSGVGGAFETQYIRINTVKGIDLIQERARLDMLPLGIRPIKMTHSPCFPRGYL